MTNLKLRLDGDYEYYSRETGDTIRVRVGYWKDRRSRGIYASICPQVLRPDGSMTCMLGLDTSVLLVATARKNDKLLTAVATRLDGLIPGVAEMFEGKEPDTSAPMAKTDPLYVQRERVQKFGKPGAAIEALRQAMVDDAAMLARAAH